MQNQMQDLASKEKIIREIEDDREGLIEEVNLYQFSLHNKQIDNNGKKAILN
ncbi:hypothetical protein [Wolbachia endosymbiont (group B) of Schoenobius gigantella]|uniref:hypothetical protein n=1 Tax=Wolbachia endosymbiont (group B) of Schoenobius gigantella TaxID=3139313 RepID=UPI003CCB2177